MNNSQQNIFHKIRQNNKYRLAHLADPHVFDMIPEYLPGHAETIALSDVPYKAHISRDGQGKSTIRGEHLTTRGREETKNNPDLYFEIPSTLDTHTVRALQHLFGNTERILHSELFPTGDSYKPVDILKGHSLQHRTSSKPNRVKTLNIDKLYTTHPEIDHSEHLSESGEDLYSPEEMEEALQEHDNRDKRDSNVTIHTLDHPTSTKDEISQMLSRMFGSILLSHLHDTDLPPDPRLDLLEDKGLIKNKRYYTDSTSLDIPYNREAQFKLIKDSTGKYQKQHALVEFAVPLLKKYIDHLLEDSHHKLTFNQFINRERDSDSPLKEVLAEILRKPSKKA